MNLSIAPEVQNDASLAIAVGRINYILASVVGETWGDVKADWSLAGERKDRSLFLDLRYEDQATGLAIDPSELDDIDRLRGKLREMWGDLLQARLHGIVGQLKKIMMPEGVAP